MSLDQVTCEEVFRAAVTACQPGRFVRSYLGDDPVRSRYVYGLALGNAAISMLRGAGPVLHGVAITRDDDRTNLPKGWVAQKPDETAAVAIVDLVASADTDDVFLVLLSGGAEHILPHDLIDGGLARLAAACPIRTLVASDRPGDQLAELAGAPTFPGRPQDHIHAVTPYGMFAAGVQSELIRRHVVVHLTSQPRGDLEAVAKMIVQEADDRRHALLAFLGPELELTGPRARLVAAAIGRLIAGTAHTAFVAASSGWDGPRGLDQPHPAGAFVDGTSFSLVYTQLTAIDYGGDIVMIG